MKYFVISDVHSFYTHMIKALHDAGFDENNPDHTLISCGDNFDRGYETNAVYQYLKSLERKILIKGNHEDLMLDAFDRGRCQESFDYSNGTANSIMQLANDDTFSYDYNDYKESLVAKYIFQSNELHKHKVKNMSSEIDFIKNNRQDFIDFIKNMWDYYETKDYIFTHAGLPHSDVYVKDVWKNSTSKDWESARWEDIVELLRLWKRDPKHDKTLVCGHWGTYLIHSTFGGKKDNYDIFYSKNIIAIDATTVVSHKCNVFVFEE